MTRTKPVYWTMFRYGGNDTICTKHTSLREAHRSAKRCEKRGGAPHWIVRVDVVFRPKPASSLRGV